jgi:hypothetical protein
MPGELLAVEQSHVALLGIVFHMMKCTRLGTLSRDEFFHKIIGDIYE